MPSAPMNEDDLIDWIFDREGRVYSEPPKNDQPTAPGGIILDTLREIDTHATVDDLRKLTLPECREIIRRRLRQLSAGVGINKIGFAPLRLQLLDFAYNSGAARAIRWLQRCLRQEPTGALDRPTLDALARADAFLLHHALAFARLQMIDQWSDPDPARAKDVNTFRKAAEEGLENRALDFSLLYPR